MTCTKIISYTVPMLGNTHTVPYGVMEVLHHNRRYTVKFGNLDSEGFNYITIGRKQYRFRNVGGLYDPRFEFLDPLEFKGGKLCARQTMTLSIPESASVEYSPMRNDLKLIVPVGTDVPMTIQEGEPEAGAEPFETGVLVCKKEGSVTVKYYVAVYSQVAVRDAQICMGDPYGDDVVADDDSWQDCDSAEVYIGIFTGSSEADVIAKVAAQEGCSESAIRLIPLGGPGKQDTEFGYLCSFAEEADFECETLPAEQMRALWTAYCFHNNLTIDTFECDAALRKVWAVLKDKKSCCWDNFNEFDHYMADALC